MEEQLCSLLRSRSKMEEEEEEEEERNTQRN